MEEDFILDLSKTYIYEGEEYILTGRTGEKHKVGTAPPRRRRRRGNSAPELDMVVEITPAPRKAVRGAAVSPTMQKELQWVKVSELYVVTDRIEDEYWNETQEDESTDSSS